MLLAQGEQGLWLIVVAIVVVAAILFVGLLLTSYFGLWIQAFLTGANITLFDLFGMTFRKVNTKAIV